MAELEALRAGRKDSDSTSNLIAGYEEELARLKTQNKEKSAKYDEVRAAKFAAEEKLRKLSQELERFRVAEEYLERQRRLLGLSRSRKEYERFILQLTAEQREVLDRIKLGGDFLVKGPAGTGKTLVLIKAIEKARGWGAQSELVRDEDDGKTLLLTYTRTLVKYDEYLSRLASSDHGAHRIQTADSFIGELVRLLDPGYRVDFERLHQDLAKKHNRTDLADADLDAEFERFIYGNAVSREEYVDDRIDRRGMKKALGREEREAVWESLESMEAEMDATRTITKSYATKILLRSLDALKAQPTFPKLKYIFIDEAQDLSAADLMLLKSCATGCLIMAGDEDQSIFRPGFSFSRAGISVVGRSRSLGKNFRNSFPILELAEKFRSTISGHDGEYEPSSDRPGDSPECYASTDKEKLLDVLVQRVRLFIEEYRYEPENLFVIAPRSGDISTIKDRLQGAGYRVKEPRDHDFDFTEPGVIRVTTMHSAKGLDAPVVFLYLPYLPFAGANLDDAAVDKIYRDLLYVAITRAMDHLDVFVNPEAKYPAIKDLLGCFEAVRS